MFTGLVETTGKVRMASGESIRRITIASALPAHEVRVGDSVAIDGCCLTAVDKSGDTLTFEAATETLSRTTLGDLRPGATVHLERAMALGDRLDGHLVMGHVDTVGIVRKLENKNGALYFGVEVDDEVARLTAPRGSICIAGVSLTVTDVQDHLVTVSLIPHTLDQTHLASARVGTKVNIEADVLARYIDRLLLARGGQAARSGQDSQAVPSEGGLTEEFLRGNGFL
ncbi:riboflavin synthase [Myxococcota bacterium]|nr:riboflavin synthase [Myxococcota bacterium]